MRFDLPADQIPTAWFNALPVLPEPLQPPLHPATREPIGPDDLAPLFPMGLIAQEVSTDAWIDIPGEVLDILRLWRPTPLVRAERLEQRARHAGAHLLQGRVGLAGRFAQAEHRGAAGLLQQGGGHRRASRPRPARASGARRSRSRAGSSTSSARCTWCARRYEQKPYRKIADGDVGERGRRRHRSTTRVTPARSGSRSPTRCATR